MNSDTAVPEARMRSFRLYRSPMTFGRAAFWTAAASYPAIFGGQVTLAWASGVFATSLGMTELLVARRRNRKRHPGLAVVGLLLALPIVALPMLLWPAQQAMKQAAFRANTAVITTPVSSRPKARTQIPSIHQTASFNLASLDAAGSFEVPPRWQTGEKRRFERVKSRRKGQGDQVTLDSTARTDLEIEVQSAHNDAFVVAWTWGKTQLDDPVLAANPVVRKMNNLVQDRQIILELDSQAAILGVRNWQELQDSAKKTLDILTNEMKAAGLDQAALAAIRTQVGSMFATKQQIETFCVREPQLFYMAQGIDFTNGLPLEFADKLPNPFGGEPIPSRGRFALKGVDKDQDVAVITFHQLATTNAGQVVGKMLTDMAKRLDKPVPADQLTTEITLEDSAEVVLELSSGWVRCLTHKRLAKAQDGWQEDVITFTRKTN